MTTRARQAQTHQPRVIEAQNVSIAMGSQTSEQIASPGEVEGRSGQSPGSAPGLSRGPYRLYLFFFFRYRSFSTCIHNWHHEAVQPV